ncbi:immunoglobulin superfamily member 8, partial [Alligator sinensis]|uniref:immunoglobulin superfamily member 8 n=1 Tax=Alligator sinensis TaxID=38654 RepID=UPI000D71FD2D
GYAWLGSWGLRGWSLATPGDTWQGLSCRQGGGCRGLWPRPGAESPTHAPKPDCSVSAGLSTAREVHVPPGPLLRVEGTAVAIPCHVTEYEGSTLQHFEWSVYRSAAPTIAIGIISTKDPAFPYAVFSSRVKSSDVAMQRLRGDAVELRIAHLQPEDDGIYECYTPSTDSQYHGSYSSKVALKVISDSLRVTAASPTPQPPLRGRMASATPLQLSLMESQELRLSCTAQSRTQEHTHLSVSFGVSAPGTPVGRHTLQEVVGIRRDFSMEPGKAFAGRLEAGELALAKLGGEQYTLVLGQVQPEDAGTYHCTAGEWIQDPDGSWQLIAEKRAVLAEVTVQPIASQLKVSASPTEVRLTTGDALELLCNLSGALPALPHVAYAVAWEVGEEGGSKRLVAQLDPDGTMVLGESYANRRVGRRHVALQKLAPNPGAYQLRVASAQPDDAGMYRCVVRVYVRASSVPLKEVARSQSPGLKVHMKAQGVVLAANAWLPAPAIYRGDTAELLCNVSLESPQPVHVAVSWWAEPMPIAEGSEPQGRLVAAVSREGVAELGPRLAGGHVSVDKVAPQCYRLRLHGVQPLDQGHYHCTATAWVRLPDRSWYQAGATRSGPITVYPYALAMDTLLVPLVAGVVSALVVGIAILATVTCCFMRRLRKR